jgi:hypothetical protein
MNRRSGRRERQAADARDRARRDEGHSASVGLDGFCVHSSSILRSESPCVQRYHDYLADNTRNSLDVPPIAIILKEADFVEMSLG